MIDPVIDAHILLGDEPMHWRLAALADIEAMQAMAPFTLHQRPAQPGRFGAARKAGWSCGDAPYLTWFDPDDRYPPETASNFLRQAAAVLDTTPGLAAVFSAEQKITSTGRMLGMPAVEMPDAAALHRSPSMLHGLQLWRRSVVASLAPSISETDFVAEWTLLLRSLDAGYAVTRLPLIARHWRQHTGQAHRSLPLR